MRSAALLLCVVLSACGGRDQCDDSDKIQVFADRDGDGWGDGSQASRACEAGRDEAERAGDCDDANGQVHPGASETCNNVDDDCDGRVDERFVTSPFYPDDDADGWGDAAVAPVFACTRPDGYVERRGDCNDGDPELNPEAVERCNDVDDDCDGLIDDDDDSIAPSELRTWFRDQDGDGYGNPAAPMEACVQPANGVDNNQDCDDDAFSINPAGIEVCNNRDDDCDGLRDDEDPSVDPASFRVWFADADLDGHGDPDTTAEACALIPGYLPTGLDCDDSDFTVGEAGPWGADGDGDGYASTPPTGIACEPPNPGDVQLARGVDCDDADPTVSPGALEICNTTDDDCDGQIDDQDPDADVTNTGTDFYLDLDGDGYGLTDQSIRRCNPPPDTSEIDGDCDDGDAFVSPGETEACNGWDDDCDGMIDDADDDVDPTSLLLWYVDADGDGWGSATAPTAACQAPPGTVASPADCDDGDPNSGAAELWYADADGDGFGTTGAFLGPACSQPAPGFVRLGDGLDCDDVDAATWPGAFETCFDGVDQDCNGVDDCTLLVEDWETGTVDLLVWPVFNGDAGIVGTPALDLWSMRLGGGVGALESRPMDTTACGILEISAMVKRGPAAPVSGARLSVEWWDGAVWRSAFTVFGNGSEDLTFSRHELVGSNPLAFHTDFAVRVSSLGLGLGGDDFYVDDISVRCE